MCCIFIDSECESVVFQQMLCQSTEASLGSAKWLVIFFGSEGSEEMKLPREKGCRSSGQVVKMAVDLHFLCIHVVKMIALTLFLFVMQINTSKVGYL